VKPTSKREERKLPKVALSFPPVYDLRSLARPSKACRPAGLIKIFNLNLFSKEKDGARAHDKVPRKTSRPGVVPAFKNGGTAKERQEPKEIEKSPSSLPN
jgi:hypothetical protein